MAITFPFKIPLLLVLACFCIHVAASIVKRGLEAMKFPIPGPRLAKWTVWWKRWYELNGGGAVNTLHDLHRRYGPVVQIAPKEISFSHPDALRDIYKGPRGLDASTALCLLRQYGSENLVSTLNADVHARRRRQVAGLYSGSSAADPVFQDNLRVYMDRFMDGIEGDAAKSPSRTANAFSWIKWLTSDIMIHLVFGEKYSRDLLREGNAREEFKELMTNFQLGIDDRIGLLVLWFPNIASRIINLLPQPKIGAFGMSCVKEELKTEVSTSSTSTPTHLQKLLSIYRKDDAPDTVPNVTYIASDCLDHFFGGTATTTDLMSAIIWRLSLPENKSHQERLRKELRDSGATGETQPDLSTVQQLPFLGYVIRETLRVHPPIPFSLPRTVKEGQEVEVMGIKIKPGTDISAHVYSVHRDPDTFEDPEAWNPDRWSVPSTSPMYKRMMRSMMPFGTGGRMCTGMNLAWAETRLLIARIYSTYETRLDACWFGADGTLLPKSARKGLYPSTTVEPIEFRKLSETTAVDHEVSVKVSPLG